MVVSLSLRAFYLGGLQGARYFLAERRREKKPYPPLQNPSGGYFWKALFVIVSGWTLDSQIGELFILEMCGQAVFCRCILGNALGVP
jgi:hypothetical protein